MAKIKPKVEPTPADWDPLICGRSGEDQSHILPPAQLRLFLAEAEKERRRLTARELREDEAEAKARPKPRFNTESGMAATPGKFAPKGIVDEVSGFVGRYVAVDEDKLLIIALWVLHTYVFDAFPQTPYLAINSPTRECGKSRLVEVLDEVCRSSWKVISPSESVLYRMIELRKPTLLVDEVDGVFKKGSAYEHLATILNAGNRANATVPRVLNPQSNTMVEFSVFCPKVLAGIGELPDTVASRSIPVRLERRTRDQKIERFRYRQVGPVAAELRNRIVKWFEDLEGGLDDEPALPDELTDRQQDCVEPLLSIADAAGCGDRARAALVKLFGAERLDSEETYGLMLLRDVKTWFDTRNGTKEAYTEWLVTGLVAMAESPWADYNGRGLNAATLSKLLRPYGVKPEPVRCGTDKQLRGYKRSAFENAWQRYVDVTGPLTGAN